MRKQNLSVCMFFKGIEVSGKQQNAKMGPFYMAMGIRKKACVQVYMCASVHVCNGERAVGGTHAGLEIFGSGC